MSRYAAFHSPTPACSETRNWSNLRGYGNLAFDSSAVARTTISNRPWNRLEPLVGAAAGTYLSSASTNKSRCEHSDACYKTCEPCRPRRPMCPTPSSESIMRCSPASGPFTPPRARCWYSV